MALFYHPDFSSEVLSEEETQHALRVLRLREGDTIGLLNGKGSWAEAIIVHTDKKTCRIRIIQDSFDAKPTPSLHLALAPTKNADRIEWLVEKATELGVASIAFILCEHSERKQLSMERLEKIAVSALKQSKGRWMPELQPLLKWKDWLAQVPDSYTKLICHLEEGHTQHWLPALQAQQDSLVLIGPEGDFSPLEIRQAQEAGFASVRLGSLRLRTETAAMAVCASFQLWRSAL
ncbi:MAG: 16S rRNA (uracil(1498)-N(3))-methyltransferase [Cytophagaceae bacterium]|jgi:16S rRNA (uracil1498-N3)-methyltransferase|nr:16S rRNA (uracil(1498)-N(3))-methyltransferase [Cytophagaceae bacterium]